MALSADLTATADLDLGSIFSGLGDAMTHADFGGIRFDASGILGLVAAAAPPDLAGVLTAAGTVSAQLGGATSGSLPGVALPGQLDQLLHLLDGMTGLVPGLDLPEEAGLDALLTRVGPITAAIETGPLPALFGLLPGLHLDTAIGGAGGVLGGLVNLARVLAGLAAVSATSTRLVAGTDLLAGRLDLPTAQGAAERLADASADISLAAAIRGIDPNDPDAVEALSPRIVGFLQAVLDVGDVWSFGMGTGEAALLGLDLTGRAAALELARLSLEAADLDAVRALATTARDLAAPVLSLRLPAPADAAGDVVEQALGGLEGVTAALRGWDPASTVAPVSGVLGVAMQPLQQARQAIETVTGAVSSAIQALRDLVEAVDLSAVTTAVQQALQPVVDTLDAIEAAVGVAEDAIRGVCEGIKSGLEAVAAAVKTAADTVTASLGKVNDLLAGLHLQDLADALRTALGGVAATLASAQLSPYFDTAIEVIDTGTSVIDAVPFGMLPTDVQQEMVDVAHPIKTLDLDPVEAALLAVLEDIRHTLDTDALDAIKQAFAAVVDALRALDPAPFLQQLEDGPLATLRGLVDGIDPQALLAPAQEALDSFHRLLAGVDLEHDVLDPLAGLFTPIEDALNGINPTAVFAPIEEAIGGVRERVLAVLHLDDVTVAANDVRNRIVGALNGLDPAALAGVLDAQVLARIADVPAGAVPSPPGGAWGSLLVTIAQASGLDASEDAVGDALRWVRVASGGGAAHQGDTDGATTVKARLTHVSATLTQVRADVASLDPVPLTAAASAQHRDLVAAVATHPGDSLLRVSFDASFTAAVPATVLGPLAENRRRYLSELDDAAALATTLAASGRSEVNAAAAELAAALAPLQAFPAWARQVLASLGIEGSGDSPGGGTPLPDLLRTLWRVAGPDRILPAVTELLTLGRDKVIAAVDTLLAPILDTVAAVHGVVDAFDLAPIIAEVQDLHDDVVAQVHALSPETMLRPVVTEAQHVIDRVGQFDPLGPVRDVVDAAKEAADRVLESARPTVVFAPVVELHHTLLGLAQGLDVEALLRPILDALDGLTVQLGDGFVRTTDALKKLQAALPDHVESSSGGVGGSVSISAGIGG